MSWEEAELTEEEKAAGWESAAEEEQADQGTFEEVPETTGLEAFVHHAGESATLGASDWLAGAAGAAGLAYGSMTEQGKVPSKQELLDAYYEAKKNEQEFRKKAMEEHPGYSMLGTAAGGFAVPVPGAGVAKMGKLGKAAAKLLPSLEGSRGIVKAGQMAKRAKAMGNMSAFNRFKKLQQLRALKYAAKEGGKVGAIAGFTQSDAKLLEPTANLDTGRLVDESVIAAEDAAKGGLTGAAFGFGVTGASHAVANYARKIPAIQHALESFSYGKAGVDLNQPDVQKRVRITSKGLISDFTKRVKSLIKEKNELFKFMDDNNITINSREDLEKVRKMIHDSVDSQTRRKDMQKVLDVLDDYLEGGAANRKAKEKLTQTLTKMGLRDPNAEAEIKNAEKALMTAIRKGKSPVEGMSSKGVVSAQDALEDLQDLPEDLAAAYRKDFYNVRRQGADGKVKTVKKAAVQVTPIKKADFPKDAAGNFKINEAELPGGRKVFYAFDESTGKPVVQMGEVASGIDAEKLTARQANNLKKLLKQYSFLSGKGDLPSEVKSAATEGINLINQKLRDPNTKVGSRLAQIDKDITTYATTEKVILNKIVSEVEELPLKQKMAAFIIGETDTNPFTDLEEVRKLLSKVDPVYSKEITQKLVDLRKQWELVRSGERVLSSTSPKSLAIGPISDFVNKTANELGLYTKKAIVNPAMFVKESAAKFTNAFTKMEPDEIGSVIQILKGKSGSERFIGQLEKAAAAPTARHRYSLLYPLTQQAAFKKMLSEDNNIYKPENEE